jgi:hypothetical protein
MNDCRNGEIRDQLPDLLHDRLSAGARAEVLAHVGGCAECREELEVLRGVHLALVAATPRIDTSRIVSALPKPPAAVAAPIRATRSRWADWRIAAAITVLAVGGTSLGLLTHMGDRPTVDRGISPPLVAIPNPPAASPLSPAEPPAQTPVASRMNVAEADRGVAASSETVTADEAVAEPEVEGRLTRLDQRQLRTLLNDISQLKATPVTEPEPVTIKIDPRTSSGAGNLEIM